VQSSDEFSSHVLNRDLWKSNDTADLIKDSFLFYQHEKTTDAGRQMCTYYHITEFPHLSIVDPNTGRQEYVIPVPTADKFPAHATVIYERLMEWIETAPTPDAKKKAGYHPKLTPSPQMPPRNNEEDELNQAMIDSLSSDLPQNKTNNTNTNSTKKTTVSPQKPKEVDVDMKEKDLYNSLALDPEPAITDPDTTMLRIRLPDGGILQRRFKKSALVEQIYRFVELTCSKQHVSLVQTMPRMQLNDYKKKTLKELNLDKATLACSFD